MGRRAEASPARAKDRRGRGRPAGFGALRGLAGACALAVVSLLATAAPAAAACPNEAFRTGASAELPECRAYEQVTPVNKHGQAVGAAPLEAGAQTQSNVVHAYVAPDGNRLLAFPLGGNPVIENALRGFPFPILLERAPSGWSGHPAIDGPPADVALDGPAGQPSNVIVDADRTGLAFKATLRISAEQPEPPVGTGALAGGGVFETNPAGGVRWLSRPSSPLAELPPGTEGVHGGKFAVVGASDDLSTVYFMARQTLTPADFAGGPGNRRTWDQSWALYEVKDGVLSNAGTLPDGTVPAAGSSSAGAYIIGSSSGTSKMQASLAGGYAVSRDGSRALFVDSGSSESTTVTAQLYLHRDGLSSVLISKPEGATEPVADSHGVVPIGQSSEAISGLPEPARAVADRDLNNVFFATPDALTDNAPDDGTHINTYRYEVATGALEYLPDLDRLLPAHPSANDPGNVYRVSDDGTRLVFRTPSGQLKLWRLGQSTITLMSSGAVASVTRLAGVTSARFADDGQTVVFMSHQAVDGNPDHPPNISSKAAATQVYRYDEGEGGTPTCISCPGLDATVRGPATIEFDTSDNGFGSNGSPYFVSVPRAISADGRRTYFTTSSTLDPRDHNTVADVYEWEAAGVGGCTSASANYHQINGGCLELVSSGAEGSVGDYLLDIDPDGNNVFFVSEERLAASDDDELSDIYDARVGGGVPPPPPLFQPEPRCEPAACQGPPAAAPRAPSPGSAGFRGPGNVAPAAVASVGLAGPRAAVGSTAKLKVRVSGAGRISVTGAKVRSAKRSVKTAGTYVVKARLNRKARRSLSHKQKLKVPVRISYRATDGSTAAKTVKVTFRRSQGKRTTGKNGKGGR